MKVITVQQLSDSFETCLASVQSGEEVMVTELGKPIARLIAPSDELQGEKSRMQRLEQQGIIRSGTGEFPAGFWDLPRGQPKEGCSVLDALLEERRDGR